MPRTLVATILLACCVVFAGSRAVAEDAARRPTYTEDVVAIHQLLARYAHAIDSGNGKAWAETFTEDGVFEYVNRRRAVGRVQIAAVVRTGNRPYTSRHMAQNALIKVDGDTATMKAYLIVTRGTEIIVTGGYEDTLKRVNGEWLFSERRFTDDKPVTPAK
jgi:uncharacterized protein (TIGR02246 family)